MNTILLSWRYLWARPLAAGLNLLLMTLGLASMSFVLLASHQFERAFERDLAGIDVVVGAKGSPMQLILAGIFHIDVPPGNIPLTGVQALSRHPQVAELIPLSLGDSFRGFRIVGTTPAYVAHYQATLSQGTLWAGPMQAVLGAQVAASTGMKAGNTFAGAHGLASGREGGGDSHGRTPYTVSGVLAPCGCVLDRLILTATESVWKVHEAMHAGAYEAEGHASGAGEVGREVTVALIRYTTPLAAVTFPRYVNGSTSMQAAAPAVEITRLLGMVGVGTRVLQGFGAVLLLTAALGVFIALWSAVRERRADLAMLRMLGAPPWKVVALLLCEALWLALIASVLGMLAGHGLTAVAAWFLQADKSVMVNGWQWVPGEIWVPMAAVGVAALAALLPAVSAYRVDVAQLLNAR
jgi:putative ABC transport system permease protein